LLIKLAILPPISLFVWHISDQTKSYVYIGGSLGLTPFNVIVTNTQQFELLGDAKSGLYVNFIVWSLIREKTNLVQGTATD